MDRSATRLTAALAPSATTAAVPARDQLTIDLTARSGALALASARREHRSLLHARDAMDEWTIAAELRPPTVRAYEAAAAELLAAASEALDAEPMIQFVHACVAPARLSCGFYPVN